MSLAHVLKRICSDASSGTKKILLCRQYGSGLGSGAPEKPVMSLCCMSGCANCVWMEYAEKMVDFYMEQHRSGGMPDVSESTAYLDSVLKDIEDPMVKAFVKLEMSIRIRSGR